jgi:hypothetical protein
MIVLASSWLGEALLFVGQAILLLVGAAVMGVAAFAFLLLLLEKVNEKLEKALEAVRETVRKERGTGVPALFTLIGAASAPLAGLFLEPTLSASLAVVVAALTFVSATVAEDERRSRAARAIAIAGCILPFLVFTAAVAAAGNFSDLSIEEQVLVVGSLALGWVGVLWALLALRDGAQPEPAQ